MKQIILKIKDKQGNVSTQVGLVTITKSDYYKIQDFVKIIKPNIEVKLVCEGSLQTLSEDVQALSDLDFPGMVKEAYPLTARILPGKVSFMYKSCIPDDEIETQDIDPSHFLTNEK